MDRYQHCAEAAKCLLWDVERLGMIIQAYEADLDRLTQEGALAKAE